VPSYERVERHSGEAIQSTKWGRQYLKRRYEGMQKEKRKAKIMGKRKANVKGKRKIKRKRKRERKRKRKGKEKREDNIDERIEKEELEHLTPQKRLLPENVSICRVGPSEGNQKASKNDKRRGFKTPQKTHSMGQLSHLPLLGRRT
jgi:hypothetical protein